jgi:hypothetical protein
VLTPPPVVPPVAPAGRRRPSKGGHLLLALLVLGRGVEFALDALLGFKLLEDVAGGWAAMKEVAEAATGAFACQT